MTFSILFQPDTAHIAVAPTDTNDILNVFAYPEKTYGYLEHIQVDKKELPQLIQLMKERGFRPTHILRFDKDGNVTGSTPYWFMYSMPDTKWWTEFPENFQVIESDSK